MQDYDPKLKSKLSSMARLVVTPWSALKSVKRLNVQLAICYIALSFVKAANSNQLSQFKIRNQKSFLKRILAVLLFFRRQNDDQDLAEKAAALDAPLSVLNEQLAALREAKKEQQSEVDILKLTDEISNFQSIFCHLF